MRGEETRGGRFESRALETVKGVTKATELLLYA